MGFTTSLKMTLGFTKLIPTLFFFMFSLLSFWFLNKAIEAIPLGMAYAIWTGIGAAGTVVIGSLFFDEHLSGLQLLFLCTLVGSIFGLKFVN